MRSTAFLAVAIAAGVAFLCSPAGAQTGAPPPLGAHPRVPSVAAPDADLLYEQGAPAHPPASSAARAAALNYGRVLYQVHCETCHGAQLNGTPGVPSLQHAGGAAIDFYLVTGRMPGAVRNVQAIHTAPHFSPQQIAAIETYVDARAASAIPIPQVALDAASLQRGRLLFEDNCEGCHGAGAQGAIAGGGWVALPLDRATPVEIGEAIRIGPGVMPRFSDAQLTPADVNALATYVTYLDTHPGDYGGTTMDDLGPAAEGLVGGVLGVGILFLVIFFTGTKADGTRLHERRPANTDPHQPR